MIVLHTLGTARIDAGSLRVTPAAERAFGLLLYLATEAGRGLTRTTVHATIFSDQTELNASHSLRQMLYRFRRAGLEIEADADRLVVPTDAVDSDVGRVLAAPTLSATDLSRIEAGFLVGYSPGGSPAFRDWLESYQSRVNLALRRVLSAHLATVRHRLDWAAIERVARALIAIDPLNEDATLALAESLAVVGSKSQAVGLLDRYVREIGGRDDRLRLSASVLRRRISERLPQEYNAARALPFLGRDVEMARLRAYLAQSRRGESQCVVVHGEPGVGKSRLAAELTTMAVLEGARAARVVAQPHDVHRPMGAFVSLVPRLIEIPGALGCAPSSVEWLRRLTRGAADADQGPTGETDALFGTIAAAICDLIDSITSEVPLLLVLEDAQWMDVASLRILAALCSGTGARRLLVLLTTRDDAIMTRSAAQGERVTTMRLGTLSRTSMGELARAALEGAGSTDAGLQQWMEDASAGNPFFLSALVDHYGATGERFVVPPTLRALLASRLERLSPASFAVLQTCVVLGNNSTLTRLVAALQLAHVEVLTHVRELEANRLISCDGAAVGSAHWLITDAVIAHAGEASLRVSHQRAAHLIESELLASGFAGDLWDCAEHWAAAAEYPRAAAAFQRCAQHALDIGRPAEAARVLRRALTLPIDDDDALPIARELAIAANLSGEPDAVLRAMDVLRRMRAGSEHDDVEIAELRALMLLGRDPGTQEERLLSCIGRTDASARHRLKAAVVLVMHADIHQKPALGHRAFETLRPMLGDMPRNDTDALELALVYHVAFGDVPTSVASARQVLSSLSDEDVTRAPRLGTNAAYALWRGGAAEEAIAALERVYVAARHAHSTRFRQLAAIRLAEYNWFMGEVDEANRWFTAARDDISTGAPVDVVADHAVVRAEWELTDGTTSGARTALGITERPTAAHWQRWTRAVNLRIRQLEKREAVSDAEVGELLQESSRHLNSGTISDLETEIAWYAMTDAGKGDLARSMLSAYLERRRERLLSPLAPGLRRIIPGDGDGRTLRAAG